MLSGILDARNRFFLTKDYFRRFYLKSLSVRLLIWSGKKIWGCHRILKSKKIVNFCNVLRVITDFLVIKYRRFSMEILCLRNLSAYFIKPSIRSIFKYDNNKGLKLKMFSFEYFLLTFNFYLFLSQLRATFVRFGWEGPQNSTFSSESPRLGSTLFHVALQQVEPV